MLDSIKTYLQEIPNIPFDIYYQGYICDIQDQNVYAEVSNIQTEEVLTLKQILAKLGR